MVEEISYFHIYKWRELRVTDFAKEGRDILEQLVSLYMAGEDVCGRVVTDEPIILYHSVRKYKYRLVSTLYTERFLHFRTEW